MLVSRWSKRQELTAGKMKEVEAEEVKEEVKEEVEEEIEEVEVEVEAGVEVEDVELEDVLGEEEEKESKDPRVIPKCFNNGNVCESTRAKKCLLRTKRAPFACFHCFLKL